VTSKGDCPALAMDEGNSSALLGLGGPAIVIFDPRNGTTI
jgi:hypothetical protein